jgi:hypothetical protein
VRGHAFRACAAVARGAPPAGLFAMKRVAGEDTIRRFFRGIDAGAE